ncbi:hypothetical protein LSUE1_G004894 [Lachnellula suecica]|uniref:Protein kinase domain-containing protein n=1 Tax=Lachnellula suecica TaxID=602035 RepID=A0A8T9CI53_9HELO|nr:hypothetical protein LSUE1_G004894 [Lachnellula suecica]
MNTPNKLQIPQVMDPYPQHPLKKVKAFNFGSLLGPMSSNNGPHRLRKLLRIQFSDPQEDYKNIREMTSNQGTLVCHRRNHLSLAVIRESHSPSPLAMLESFAHVHHSNVADILDVYFYSGQLLIIGEHLDISLLNLNFKPIPPEEWEIATIIAEIIKGMSYLLDTGFGSVLDLHYEPKSDDLVANTHSMSFLNEILGFMMSQGISQATGWSKEALDFSSLSGSESLTPFLNHVFLTKAVSSSKLAPRIHLASQMLF